MNIKLVDYGLRISDIGIRPMENGFILHIDDEHKIEDYFNNPDILYNVYKENKDFFKNKRCTRESLFRHIKNGYIKPSFEFSNFVYPCRVFFCFIKYFSYFCRACLFACRGRTPRE